MIDRSGGDRRGGQNLCGFRSRKTAPPQTHKNGGSNGVLIPRTRKEIKIMARDGTNRGGRRVRAGDKPAPAAEKIQKGQQVQILNNDIPTLSPTELEAVDLPEGAVMNGVDMPKPSDYLSARQKNGIPLGADEIYKETWLWLKERNCEKLVNPRLIEAYAQAFARYIQCEEATSTYGLLGKHPTTGGVITSLFVQMSQQYQKSANLIWYEIYDIVKQNCTEVFEDNPNDTMELLLRARRK